MDESRTRQERGANKEFFHIVYPCLSSSKELIECILVSGELLTDRACQAGIRQARGNLTVVSYLTVKIVLGKYTTRILLDAGQIVPAGKDARGHPLFEARALHHSLSRLARASSLIEPRVYQPRHNSKKNDGIELDVERALAQLAEE